MSKVTELRPDNNDVVMLELDRPRELRLGHKALKRFSALTGCSMAQMGNEVQRYDRMSLLIYVMLSEDDPDLTPEAVDELIDQAERRKENCLRLKDTLNAAYAAIAAALPEEDDEQEDNQEETPPQAAGTGEKA